MYVAAHRSASVHISVSCGVAIPASRRPGVGMGKLPAELATPGAHTVVVCCDGQDTRRGSAVLPSASRKRCGVTTIARTPVGGEPVTATKMCATFLSHWYITPSLVRTPSKVSPKLSSDHVSAGMSDDTIVPTPYRF